MSKEFLPNMSACYKDKRVTVHIGDGFKFLPDHKNRYDVIITDSSDPVGPAEALFKAPYFTLLKEALREGGNMSTQAECLWVHLPLIRELKTTCSKTFPVAEYAFTTIPTCEFRLPGIVDNQTPRVKSVSWCVRRRRIAMSRRRFAQCPTPSTTTQTSTEAPSWLYRSSVERCSRMV